MFRAIYVLAGLAALLLSSSNSAEAYCSAYTSISNGSPADATQVMGNFACAALTSGSTIEGLTSTSGQYFTYGTDGFVNTDNSVGLSSGQYLYLQGDTAGGLWLAAAASNRWDNIVLRNDSHKIDFMTSNLIRATISSAGNFGIGSTSPTEKLYVSGNIYATGNVTCGGTCGGGSSYWSLSGTNLVPASTTYNVGVGSITSPTHTLDVGGTLNVTGALTCGSGCAAGPFSVSSGSIVPSSTSYNLGIGTASPTAMVDVYGAGSSGVRVLSASSSSSTSFVVGRTGSEGYFAVAGAANQWALGTAAGDVVVSNPASGKVMLSSRASSATAEVTLTAGKVGINSTTPSQALDVVGSLNVSGSITCGSGCTSGPWSVSGSNIIPSSTSYYVGIGTASPSQLLTVGNGSASLNADVAVNGGTNSGTGVQIAIQKGGSSKGWVGTHSRIFGGTSDALALASAGALELAAGGASPQMSITSGGTVTVGDGTSTLNSDLFINGGANSGKGVQIAIQRGGSSKGWLGTHSRIYGGTSDAIALVSTTALELAAGGNNPQVTVDTSGNLTVVGCVNFNGGTSGTCVSDERVKRDIKPFTSVGLAEISTLRPITYSYNGLGGTPQDSNKDDVRTGLIAQEVRAVAPSLVSSIRRKLSPGDASPTDVLEVKYAALVFGLINAVKELKAANDGQATQIELLQKQIRELPRKTGIQAASK